MNTYPFFLCAQSRSGSNFLMSLINSTRYVGYLQETLTYGERERYKAFSDAEMDAYFEKVRNDSLFGHLPDQPTSTWGTKVAMSTISFVERWLTYHRIPHGAIKWIWLQRRDKILQAYSHLRAGATGIWRLTEGDNPIKRAQADQSFETTLDALKHMMCYFFLADDAWKEFFERHRIQPFKIFYENFIEEDTWQTTVMSIFEYLGVEYGYPLGVTADTVRRNDETVPEIYREFLSHDPLFEGWLREYYPLYYEEV